MMMLILLVECVVVRGAERICRLTIANRCARARAASRRDRLASDGRLLLCLPMGGGNGRLISSAAGLKTGRSLGCCLEKN